MKPRLAILTTTINPEIIKLMLKAAIKAAIKAQANVTNIVATIGCLDMPVIAQALLAKKNIDGLIVLGAVAKGDTKHDELVVNNMTQAIIQLSLKYNKAVGFGVIGPGAKKAQFKTRTATYAARAVEATVKNWQLLRKLT